MVRRIWLFCLSLSVFTVLLPVVGTAAQPAPPTRTPLPSLTPSPTLALSIPTGQPGTPVPLPSFPASPTAPEPSPTSPLLALTSTPLVAPPTLAPALLPGNAPPLQIRLPAGWKVGYQVVPIRASLVEATMNLAVYIGPVQNGLGTILVLWGFPSLASPRITPDPNATPGADPFTLQMLYADGLRLLQGTVLDITCNVGTAGERSFTVGGVTGSGTFFNVSQCQGEPDTAGWFVGVSQYGRNYLFYAYIDPIEAYNDARGELQRILDTITFDVPTPTPTVTGTP